MRYIGKLWHQFNGNPEFKALLADINDLHDMDTKFFTGINNAYGDLFFEFAKSQDERTSHILMKLQELGKSINNIYQDQLISTSSFPSDINQIENYQKTIHKKRNELKEVQTAFNEAEKNVAQKLSAAEKIRATRTHPLDISNSQAAYDRACSSKEEALQILESKRQEVSAAEFDYRKTIMQIIIASLETYCTASSRLYSQLGEYGQQMHDLVQNIIPETDSTIEELEARMKILETDSA